MNIEQAKAELQEALSGPAGKGWGYAPAVKAVLDALANTQKQLLELETRGFSSAVSDVLAERRRQVTSEGYTHEQDDRYTDGELREAAACYIVAEGSPSLVPELWPWPATYWKPTNLRRDLVKAGALILAEIERLDRQTALREAAK
ncbi:TPA: hypothetical protein QCH64_002730 [Enterobacter asburiae]|uniref:hypothetical protein n=1 Tax=Enterobacter asburiae TaxID=61645 RepID=UPI001A25F45E|nr:hypothetical protein [Enterobacter asburiae]MCS0625298.1 hypothetical protein [Enterobacter asburiae]HAT7488637.1 hypothetical protein [Enterobacter asburiae]HAT7510197.1 hypothetical protein [Enterobacter asburiae]HDR2364433.1 hypothetical protein [Enterobacter asburiae]